MKTRLITFAALCCLLISLGAGATAAAADFRPQAGLYYVNVAQGVTFHTYTTPLAEGATASVIIETPHALILQDVQVTQPCNDDLNALIASLNKPLTRIYLSHDHDHHWLGLAAFEGVPVYAGASTIATIQEHGESLLAGAKHQYGEELVPYTNVPVPEHELPAGEEIIDGVRFVYSTPFPELTGAVTWTEFPDQQVVIMHHLAYNGVQLPVPPIDARIEALTQLQGGIMYNYIICGHGVPTDADDYYEATLGYYKTLGSIVGEAPDVVTAKEVLLQAYPDWGGGFFLDMMLPAYYQK